MRHSQMIPAFAVFFLTFFGWLGVRWYEGERNISASLQPRTDVYQCGCSCAGKIDIVAEYGDTLEKQEASACLQTNGDHCSGIGDTAGQYSNCSIVGKKVEGGVIQP